MFLEEQRRDDHREHQLQVEQQGCRRGGDMRQSGRQQHRPDGAADDDGGGEAGATPNQRGLRRRSPAQDGDNGERCSYVKQTGQAERAEVSREPRRHRS
jgi:hypothetical protein